MNRGVHLAWLLLAMLPAVAQEPAREPSRPTIGLVLGGGGARGFAHVGVLEWFEQHRIPIDYLAGTSMGGLVGGLYASGMSTADMREFITGMDWQDVFRDSPPYPQMDYRRKEDRQIFQNGLEVGLREGISLPRGLVDGQKIGLLLTELTLPAAAITDFDQLPIPFRCVATDMTAAEPVVFTHGSLPLAMRATMAIPGVFAPVELGGKILADGGLLNNVPTDVAKAMGADIVIAVDIGTPLGDTESLDTLVGMVNQSISVMIVQNVRNNLRLADVILSPQLDEFSSASFSAAETIVERGHAAAEAKTLLLRNLALDDEAWQKHLARRRARLPDKPIVPTFLEIERAERVPVDEIARRLDHHLGRPLAPDGLANEIAKLYGDGYYSRIQYRPILRDGATGLVIRVDEKDYGPPFLRLHLDFRGGTNDETQFTFLSRITTHGLTGYGSEWRNDVRLGRSNLLGTEYYQPLAHGRLFAAPRAWYETSVNDLFSGEQRAAVYRTRQLGAGLDAGFEFNESTRLSAGLAFGAIDQNTSLGAPLRPNLHEPFGYARTQFVSDRRDNAVIPRRGLRVAAEGRWYLPALGTGSEFQRLAAEVQWFQPLSEADTLFLLGRGGTTFGSNPPPYGEFLLGGIHRLGAYPRDRFRGNEMLYGGVGWLHQVAELPFLLGGPIYANGVYEVGGAFRSFEQADYQQSLSLGVMASTLLGPAYLGYSYGEGGSNQLQFSLGKLF